MLDFRPGIIPLRPLQIGDLFGGVFKAVRGNVAATVGLAALTSALALVPFTALGTWIASMDTTAMLPGGDAADPEAPLGIGVLGSYLPSIASAVSAILLAGFLAYVIGQAVLGRKVSMAETWAGTKGRILHLVGATLLIGFAVLLVMVVLVGIPAGIVAAAVTSGYSPGGGMIALLVVLGILWFLLLVLVVLVVMTRLAFVTPAIVLERQGVMASVARSWRMVGSPRTKPFWRILGLRLLTSFVVGMASSIVTVPLMIVMLVLMVSLFDDGGTMGDLYMLQTVITGLVGIITGALTTPFTAGIDALLYVDTRIRTEGLDVTLMRAAEGQAPPPWPAATPT